MTMRRNPQNCHGFTQHHFSLVGFACALGNVKKKVGISSSNDHMKSGAGFTLIELVLYLGLSSIVVLASTSFLTAATKVRVHTKQQQNIQSEIDAVSGRLSYTLRNAYRVELDVPGTRIDVYAKDPSSPDPIVTSFQVKDGALYTGKNSVTPAADLYMLTNAATSVTSLSPFEVVSSSLKVMLSFTQGPVTVPFESVYAFRQS